MASSTTPGRRVEDGTDPQDLRPGDYAKRGARWWVCLPTGQLGLLDDGWTVTEHDDRTVTVSPSIHDAPEGWHGFLKAGVWVGV